MTDIAQIAQRLIKWDADFPVNCWNGYAGLKELDRIIEDAKVALTNAGLPFVDDLGDSPSPATQMAGSKAESFDRIVAARKKHVDAVAAYNARRELANAERMHGSWAIKLDAEYHAMSDAQSEFHRTVQDACDAALAATATEGAEG
ncbi:hypothetical protein ACC719_29550 [Rhizobium ruizarguesonis]